MIYGTYLPGLGNVAMAIDSDGNAYLAGSVPYDSVPTTSGAFQTMSSHNTTGAILKLNAAGSALVYATYLGGAGAGDITQVQAIAADASGNVYVTGYVQNNAANNSAADFPVTPGAYQTVPSVNSAFVTKLNASGSGLVYSTFLGGTGQTSAIKVDSHGRAYILGSLGDISPSFPTTPGAFQPSAHPPPAWAFYLPNAFLASLSADGSALVYGTYVSGAGSLDVDASGNAYVAGNARSGFPVTAGALQPCYNGNSFAAEFGLDGKLLGATYFGPPSTKVPNTSGGNPDMGGGIAVGPNGMVWVGTGGSWTGLGSAVNNFLINNPRQQDGPCVSPIVQNAANYDNFGTQVSPGELITLQGVGIGPQGGAPGSLGPNELLPANLAGVQVFFDKFAAPLMYASAGQINAQVPWEIGGQTATQVQVIYNGTPMNSFGLSVAQATPSLFFLNYHSSQAAILNVDGSINSASNPAHAGDVIALFGTGGGPTSPVGVTGGFWGPGTSTLLTLPVTVQIEGRNAPVVYAGAAPGLSSGFFQINVQVPPGLIPGPNADIEIYLGPPDAPAGNDLYQATVAVQ